MDVSDHRLQKLEKRKHPRGRSFVGKQKKAATQKASKEKKEKEAQSKIEKHLERFSNDETREKQIKIYTRWLKDSLEQGQPILDEGDIEFKTAVASVKAGGQQRQKSQTSVRATHLPTLISVRNEEERSLEQNKKAATEKLQELLNSHLQIWKILKIKSLVLE